MNVWHVGGWRFHQELADRIYAWAPGARPDSRYPDAVLTLPRSLAGSSAEQVHAFTAEWLRKLGAPLDPEATRLELHFKGTRSEFLRWLRIWEPMQDNNLVAEKSYRAGDVW